MTKSNIRQADKILTALRYGIITPDIAATGFAVMHRSALRSLERLEIDQLMTKEGLLSYVHIVNGCMVPRY
jgi:hypothetical protein